MDPHGTLMEPMRGRARKVQRKLKRRVDDIADEKFENRYLWAKQFHLRLYLYTLGVLSNPLVRVLRAGNSIFKALLGHTI